MLAQGLGCAAQPELRGRIGNRGHVAVVEAVGRADGNDLRMLRAAQVRRETASEREKGAEIDVEDLCNLVVMHLFERRFVPDPGYMDQGIDGSLADFAPRVLHRTELAEIRLDPLAL